MWNRVKLLCIVSGIFDATPGKAQIMNEILLYAGFINGVTSLFVPNLCSEQDNKVSGAEKTVIDEIIFLSVRTLMSTTVDILCFY